MSADRDRALREQVRRALAAAEADARAPDFEHLWRRAARPPERRRALLPVLGAAAVGAAAILLVVITQRQPEPIPGPFDELGVELLARQLWVGPTDVALTVSEPGERDLHDVPTITLPDAPPIWPFAES